MHPVKKECLLAAPQCQRIEPPHTSLSASPEIAIAWTRPGARSVFIARHRHECRRETSSAGRQRSDSALRGLGNSLYCATDVKYRGPARCSCHRIAEDSYRQARKIFSTFRSLLQGTRGEGFQRRVCSNRACAAFIVAGVCIRLLLIDVRSFHFD